jgi:hypothetical protein
MKWLVCNIASNVPQLQDERDKTNRLLSELRNCTETKQLLN